MSYWSSSIYAGDNIIILPLKISCGPWHNIIQLFFNSIQLNACNVVCLKYEIMTYLDNTNIYMKLIHIWTITHNEMLYITIHLALQSYIRALSYGIISLHNIPLYT